MMKKSVPAASPDAYVAALTGWRRELVETLRAAVRGAATLEEVIKWGHIVYYSNGPVLLIRAEDERVLFGFWRGKRLQHIEPRLQGSGKYELRTADLREGMALSPAVARRLTRQAVALNKTIGNPTKITRPVSKVVKAKRAQRRVRQR
jgi:hypothetical protein